MYAKLEINGKLEILTGMHIGGSSAFSAIGAVDSPVVRDILSDRPMIPGSSLKGKLRSLLASEYNEVPMTPVEDDDPRISRLFGSAKSGAVKFSRLIFRDMILNDEGMSELKEAGLYTPTEVKFENTINRVTSVANPRQIERVIRGCVFDINILYNAQNIEEAAEDIAMLAEGMRLLEYDYLGGHGSRGYGKIKFTDLNSQVAVGEMPDQVLEQCRASLSEV